MSFGRSGGKRHEIGLPIISSAEYPNNRSAPRFQVVTMPLSVLLMMASSEFSTIDASRRAVAAAFLRADTSRKTSTTPSGEPLVEDTGAPQSSIGVSEPLFEIRTV